MGLPELPDQNEEIDFRMEENIVINTDGTTDDSENEYNEENAYMGYQPLNMRDMNSMMEDSDTSESNDPEIHDDDSIELLNVDVWNAPRPNELNIELGPEKAEQVSSRLL